VVVCWCAQCLVVTNSGGLVMLGSVVMNYVLAMLAMLAMCLLDMLNVELM